MAQVINTNSLSLLTQNNLNKSLDLPLYFQTPVIT